MVKGVRTVCCLVAVSGVVAAGAAAHAAARQTISLLEVDTSFAPIGGYNLSSDAPPAPGQGITFAGTLYRWAGTSRGAAAGHVQAVCTVSSPATAICEGLITLPSGTLALLGPANFNGGPGEVSVVGGSGAYVGAQGYMASRDLGGPNSNRSADVIHLT